MPKRLGDYEILRPIAHGGMADIYLARRVDDPDRFVAVKILNSRRANDEEACSMFLDEARLVGMFDHENIASVLEADIVDDQLYLAMEYVHGTDLRELLSACMRAGHNLPYVAAISIIKAAAAGLDHAHRRCDHDGKPLRLVHRDISLSNIMVGHDGVVKVVDFGIASTAIATVHTNPGVVRGKASYMSPEQCLGDKLDHRSDVFALGVVLYELTTGARCFSGKTDFERMLAVVRGEYLDPANLVADYPEDLANVIRHALSTDMTQRYASAAALMEVLDDIARARGWEIGKDAIAELMRETYGEVPEPWRVKSETIPTSPHLPSLRAELQPDTVRSEPLPTMMARQRLARGSQSELMPTPPSQPYIEPAPDPSPVEEELTRGRRTFKRPPSVPTRT
jgi:eukaryotic-like serine/threonine-protein kinase